jgi:ribonuclease HI
VDFIPPTQCWNKQYNVQVHHSVSDPETLHKYNKRFICYTDGSKTKSGVGSGYIIYHGTNPIRKQTFKMKQHSSVFQAEVQAILEASQLLKDLKGKEIIFLSDSQAALSALAAFQVSSELVQRCLGSLNRLGSKNKVTLYWVKAHVGHKGNEEADALAKQGTELPENLAVETKPPRRNLIRDIALKASREWENRWQSLKSCRKTKLWFNEPSDKIAKTLAQLSREKVYRLAQFITGHCCLNRHQHLIGNIDSPTCRMCMENDETPEHLVTECAALCRQRFITFAAPTLNSVPDWDAKQLLGFLRDTHIWKLLAPNRID